MEPPTRRRRWAHKRTHNRVALKEVARCMLKARPKVRPFFLSPPSLFALSKRPDYAGSARRLNRGLNALLKQSRGPLFIHRVSPHLSGHQLIAARAQGRVKFNTNTRSRRFAGQRFASQRKREKKTEAHESNFFNFAQARATRKRKERCATTRTAKLAQKIMTRATLKDNFILIRRRNPRHATNFARFPAAQIGVALRKARAPFFLPSFSLFCVPRSPAPKCALCARVGIYHLAQRGGSI